MRRDKFAYFPTDDWSRVLNRRLSVYATFYLRESADLISVLLASGPDLRNKDGELISESDIELTSEAQNILHSMQEVYGNAPAITLVRSN